MLQVREYIIKEYIVKEYIIQVLCVACLFYRFFFQPKFIYLLLIATDCSAWAEW